MIDPFPPPHDAPPARRRGVSICVFRGDTVLMVKRGKAPGRGLWAPVGGHVEPGESLVQAALRETREETGVTCRLIGESGRRDIVTATGVIELVVHAALWVAGEPVAGDDAAEARFVALDALGTLPLVEGVVPHILTARRLLDGSPT